MKMKLLGPPGTGKTTRLIQLFEGELKHGIHPDRIGFLTFTRAAREEALKRTGLFPEELPNLKTIHAICYKELEIGQRHLVKPSDLYAFGRKMGAKLSGVTEDPWLEEAERTFDIPSRDDALLQITHRSRHQGIPFKKALVQDKLEVDPFYANWFFGSYKDWKKKEGFLDYTDLLTEYVDKGKPLDIDVLFVDEAQDLSLLQWDVIRKLGVNASRWYVAGDDDQAIFQWAGADSGAFQAFSTDAVEVLGQSYRIPRAIYKKAMRVVNRINHRTEKRYDPRDSDGSVIDAYFLQQCQFNEQTFILVRNHYRGNELSKQLKDDCIPYIGHGSPLFDPSVRNALKGWHALFRKGDCTAQQAKAIMKYAYEDYIHFDIQNKLQNKSHLKLNDIFMRKHGWFEWPKLLNKLPCPDYIQTCIHKFGWMSVASPKIELLSIHQSKGREAHTVVLDSEVSRAVYEGSLANPDDEHRVWYVGVTRAKERLYSLKPLGVYSYKL